MQSDVFMIAVIRIFLINTYKPFIFFSFYITSKFFDTVCLSVYQHSIHVNCRHFKYLLCDLLIPLYRTLMYVSIVFMLFFIIFVNFKYKKEREFTALYFLNLLLKRAGICEAQPMRACSRPLLLSMRRPMKRACLTTSEAVRHSLSF